MRLYAFVLAATLTAVTSISGGTAGQGRTSKVDAVVPVQHIAPGTTLEASMLAVEKVRPRAYRQTYTDVDAVTGREASHVLRAGQPVQHNDLRSPTFVDRGQRVQVLYQAGAVKVSTTGEARERGGKGDVVDVLILDTQESTAGTIVAPGTVRVNAGG